MRMICIAFGIYTPLEMIHEKYIRMVYPSLPHSHRNLINLGPGSKLQDYSCRFQCTIVLLYYY